ncbi:MAG: flagellar filament capping protein FliD [Ruminococcus sp.]|jgi:flagellar capping protein FliD|nr:flagellar filament capping protein FliD [Ruminococcus sp.]
MAESSSSSASSLEVSGNKMAGLMSGLDTAALVESMTAATLKRLENQKAKSQKLTWQQEGYRDIIDKLKTFQEKFTSLTSSTSLRLRSNLSKSKAVSSDDRVTATATGSATATTYSIAGATSAKTTRIKSSLPVSTGTVDLDLSKLKEGQGYTLKLTLDGNQKDVYFVAGKNASDNAGFLEDAVNKAFGETFTAGYGQQFIVDSSGKMNFYNGSDGVSHNFTVGHNKDFGLSNDTSNRLTNSMKLSDITFTAGALKNNQLDSAGNELNYFGFEINGVSFGFTKENTIADIISAVNNSDAKAKLSFDQMSGKMTLESSSSGAGGELNLKQTSGNLLSRLFGETDLDDGIATVSKKMTYDSYGSVSAAVDPAIIEDIGKDGITGDTEYVFKLNIDGKDYELKANKDTFPPKTGDKKTYSWSELESQFVKQLKDQYTDKAATDPSLTKTADEYFAGFTIKGDSSTNRLTFTDNNKPITLTSGTGFTPDAKNSNITQNVFTDSTVILKGEAAADGTYPKQKMTFEADGLEIAVEGSAADGSITLRDLTESGLFSYNSNGYLTANADITLGGKTDANAEKFLNDYFGGGTTGTGSIADAKSKMDYQRGEDATLTLRSSDGTSTVKYQNASDSFTIDGTTINVSGLNNFTSAAKEDDITVGVSKDYTAVKELITDFVEGYNSLLDDVRSYYDTTRPRSSGSYYEPLTAAQKKEMTADEIKDWETQAKIGLLYNDDNLQRVLDDLHSAMNTVVGGFSAAAAGIELTDSFLDNNKFKVNEDKLDNALAKYGDKLVDFFTNAENGLATKLNKAIDGMASTSSSAKYGYLVREAGVAGDPSDKKSEIYNQLQNFQDMIDQISERYKKQQESYWQRFTALETYLAKMNMQAGMFTQQSY